MVPSQERIVAPFRAHAHTGDTMTFLISLGPDRAFVVTETQDRAGGLFSDLSSALRFIHLEGRNRGCGVKTRFDQSLAAIRAAG